MKKIALLTGVTGQDGAYLARFLLKKGYEVHGVRRRSSLPNFERIKDLIEVPQRIKNNFYLHYGDLSDGASISRLVHSLQPDEIYNLAAQSQVHVSFDVPEYTADVNGIGTLRLLEAAKNLNEVKPVRLYQASTSELFGKIQSPSQNESTPFYPRSPYGVAKLYAYWATVNYREAYGLFACNGILFNHESKLRGKSFVTRKITAAVADIAYGLLDCLYLGNLDAQRDWGHAKDYVEAQWLMLQQDNPEDYVIASGRKTSVREFVEMAFFQIGIVIEWSGEGADEFGRVASVDSETFSSVVGELFSDIKAGDVLIKVDPYYFRPAEVDTLWGDASKAKEKLGWSPKVSLEEMVEEMVSHDLSLSHERALVEKHRGGA